MKKISKLFSFLLVLFVFVGLVGCNITLTPRTPDPEPDPENMDIATAAEFETFLKNGSSTGKLTASFNVNTTSVVPSGKEKILNLNGKTVTYASNATGAVIKVMGKLTIIDTSSTTLSEQGKLANTLSNGAAYAVFVAKGNDYTGNVIINAGQYESVGAGNCLGVFGSATVTKAKFIGGTGVCVSSTGVVESLAGDIQADQYAVYNEGHIKLISNLDAGYEVYTGESTGYGTALYNDGTIDRINQTNFTASGIGELYGLNNGGTIGIFSDVHFVAADDTNGTAGTNCFNWNRNVTGMPAASFNGATFEPALIHSVD